MRGFSVFVLLSFCCLCFQALGEEVLDVGLIYPRTGNFKQQGLAQMRAALLAVDEINAQGGVLGKKVRLRPMDSGGRPDKAARAVETLAAANVRSVVGGASSEEVLAISESSARRNMLYFVPQAASADVTGRSGRRNLFQEGCSARMAGRALLEYLDQQFPNQKFFYITAGYTYADADIGAFFEATSMADRTAGQSYRDALKQAVSSDAKVLVLMLYGDDLVQAMPLVDKLGLRRRMQIVVPYLNQDIVEQAGPGLMEGVIGADTWAAQVPRMEGSSAGQAFNDAYVQRYQAYPSSTAASTYGILYQWADAVRRASSADPDKLIMALEGHDYRLLKGEQQWRAFDHQNLQTLYVLKVKPRAEIMKDPLKQDYFEVVHRMDGDLAAPTLTEWQEARGVGRETLN
ncbi:ABC transporter substrate-binding protein [Pseudomonas citronellolis]|uniref:ABC transporter substrate-binding protein n=1 Tax=Pseudomonas citronellolis TaxID=53408 RepID=UPI0021C19ACC|nr:ABC transporter substrate-binding protein [Pseudomonas citronellolis]UXJ50205.1 ABC transporter substrate-binding protein [Pseudomonas citronellolis]